MSEAKVYALEQLYQDQHPDLVIDTIPALLAWIPGTSKAKRRAPFRFSVGWQAQSHQVDVRWTLAELSRRDPGVEASAARMLSGMTPHREHVTQLAAYGLAMVALSIFLPGRRVLQYRCNRAPDLLLSLDPTDPSGVEVSGRARGGNPELDRIHAEKLPGLLRLGASEVWLSLWCASPRLGRHVKVLG